MRVVVQRVTEAAVEIGGRRVSAIGPGLLVLACIEKGDGEQELQWMAEKIRSLRIFEDAEEKMNLSVEDVGGEILAVSQFTLASRIAKGRRPGFEQAEEPAAARAMFERFVRMLSEGKAAVKQGVFQAMMKVSLVNDGPVTFIIERGGDGSGERSEQST